MATPPVVRFLVASNVLVFLVAGFLPAGLLAMLPLWPLGQHAAPGVAGTVGFAPWQLVTYAFLHGNLPHLVLNMFGLWTFGREIERYAGSREFAYLYAVSVLVAGLAQVVVVSLPPVQAYPTVGASGGVFGVLLAFAMLFPRRRVMLLIPPIPMPAWLFVTGYAALELYWGVTGTEQGIAHFAHLGGMAGAWFVVRRWRAAQA